MRPGEDRKDLHGGTGRVKSLQRGGTSRVNREAVWKILCIVRRLVNHLPHRAALRVRSDAGTLLWIWDKKRVDGAEASLASGSGSGNARGTAYRAALLWEHRTQCRGVYPASSNERTGEAFRHRSWRRTSSRRHRPGKGVILLTAHFGSWRWPLLYLRNGISHERNRVGTTGSPYFPTSSPSCGALAVSLTIGKGFDPERSSSFVCGKANSLEFCLIRTPRNEDRRPLSRSSASTPMVRSRWRTN